MKRTIVIIGGGAIGCCSAYYLSKHPKYDPETDSIFILESNEVASGSSGKGGGLIARWAEPECLARPSFLLHQELADRHDGPRKWGYRRVTCADCVLDTTDPASVYMRNDDLDHKLPKGLNWIDRAAVRSYDPVGNEDDTAQCDPNCFTTAMFEEAAKAGVCLVRGTVVLIDEDEDATGQIIVRYRCSQNDDSTLFILRATQIVVAAGPWSSMILPEAPVYGARCHSIVCRPKGSLTNNLLFMDVTYPSRGQRQHLTPEVYPRMDDTAYACEAADMSYEMPSGTAEVNVDKAACDRIEAAIKAVSSPLKGGEVVRRQVCYQPVVVFQGERKKLVGPYLGHTSIPGVFIACGHDSWGISNAPGTGKALSELIYDGASASIGIESLAVANVMSRARG